MEEKKIPLTKQQKEIIGEFYALPPETVVFNKRARNALWKKATAKSNDLDFDMLGEKCPALLHQIKRSYETGGNIQSAVFSECVYAQTFANAFGLTEFANCYEEKADIPEDVIRLLRSYSLQPRYVYATPGNHRMLIQAGGCDGVDSALITVMDLVIYTIEFKEPGAKTSEPDLPKYGEDGRLSVSENWLEKYPQFGKMLQEQAGLNFFDNMGNNIHNFSKESIEFAVSNNYSRKKYADVICTEDVHGKLVMMPTNQVARWADTEGEIRPAGRNHYAVWTPVALQKFLTEKGAVIENGVVRIKESALEKRKERGGNRRVSGYKINPLFFVYVENCTVQSDMVGFDIKNVQQLNPTIAGKMFFKKLKYGEVKEYYGL